MRAFAFAFFLCLPSLAAAEQPQYNPYTKRYEYAPKGPHRNTIHTGNSGSLSALAKRFSSIRTRGNVSMLLREPCRATIPTRSSESLSALTSCVPASSVALLKAALGMPLPSRCLFIYLLSCHALTKAEIHWADIPRASSLRCRSFQLERQPTHPA